ncbi:hypothetical protein [Glycomyces harbinensis]|uniref:Uncharacterized protein n=1 Tax=Glycomyces harbinensis TaxID=58114 RepID=A0A1G6XIL4_9ACTN|nr:hypothetical protein [Glycomyces harbinensis]SDD77147.1 hypothetical protein SAMN05216270_107156 [Glycomyces harbinensis]
MAELGGYLAVSYVAEHVVVDALEAVWRTEWKSAVQSGEWAAATPFGRLEATGTISIDQPRLRFDGAANRVAVQLAGAGRFELTLEGQAAGAVLLTVDATAAVPVHVSQEHAWDKAVVDLSQFTLDTAQVGTTILDGPTGLDPLAALASQDARAAFTALIRDRAQPYLTFRLLTNRLWSEELALMTSGIPGSVLITPLVKLGDVRILGGWLALGIDATSGVGVTHGNAAAIGPPPDPPPPGLAPMPQMELGEASARLVVDPGVALTYLQVNAKFAVIMATATRPNIHPDQNVGVRFEDGTIVVNATGTVDAPDPFAGNFPFTAEVRVRPFVPRYTNTVYASVAPNIRVDTPLFLQVLGTLAEFFGVDVFEKLHRANRSEMAILFGVKASGKVPELTGVYARIEGRQIVVRPDLLAVFGEAAVTTTFSETPRPEPYARDSVHIRERILRLRLDPMKARRLLADPTFLIQYRVRRSSDGVELANGTAWSGSDQAFGPEIDMWEEANLLETSYDVELNAERPPGTQVAFTAQAIRVRDKFDRSHPFVRWNKDHFYTPEPFGSQVPNPVLLFSAIHRTRVGERCRFGDETGAGHQVTPYEFEPLDALPAPDTPGFSNRLCPYCFPED